MSLCQEPVAVLSGKPPAHQSRCGVLISTMCVEGHLVRAPAAGVFTVHTMQVFFFISKHPLSRPQNRQETHQVELKNRPVDFQPLSTHGNFLTLPDLEGTILKKAQELGQD